MFIRHESLRAFLKFYPIVSLLIIIHFALFIIVPLLPGGDIIYYWGVGQNGLIAQGEYWRIITPIFLHANFAHVLFNSFSLYLFGPALERMLGKITFIASYLAMGVAANIFTFFLESSFFTHVGASGAIYGLFGIYLYMVMFRKDLIDYASSQIVTTILVIGLITTFVLPRINVIAHIFGLISGLAIAPVILVKAKRFTMPIEIHRRKEYDEPAFNPNRWKRRRLRFNKDIIFKMIWGLFILFVLAGLIAYLR